MKMIKVISKNILGVQRFVGAFCNGLWTDLNELFGQLYKIGKIKYNLKIFPLCSVMNRGVEWGEGRFKREGVYVHLWLIHTVVH